MLQRHGLKIKDKLTDTHKLLSIGSVLHFAHDHDVIWGSGVNGKISSNKYRFTSLDVRAVRGPHTRFFLQSHDIDCPPVFGDPALLLPLLFPEFTRDKNADDDYLVIPHMHDVKLIRSKERNSKHMLSVSTDWKQFIKKILNTRLVLSTSLHGLIVAEAFGIPARLLRVSEHEPLFKFEDYYSGTGRYEFEPVTSVAEGLSRGGEPPAIFDPQALLAAFPIDLWRPTHNYQK